MRYINYVHTMRINFGADHGNITIDDYINNMNPKPKKLLDRVRETIRLKQYSNKKEQAYLNWIKQYILFPDKKPTRYSHDRGGSVSYLPRCMCFFNSL